MTDAERMALEAQLAQLQSAYDTLISGGAVASVGHSGRAVTYAAADKPALLMRINEIKVRLGLTRRRCAIPTF